VAPDKLPFYQNRLVWILGKLGLHVFHESFTALEATVGQLKFP
jgi:hypothetical protein